MNSEMDGKINVLLVEDNAGDSHLLRQLLQDYGEGRFQLDWTDRLSMALSLFGKAEYHVVLLDLSLPDSRGLDTLVRLRTELPDVPIVVLTGTEDEDLASGALKAGAQDYLVKGKFDAELLVRAMRYSMERHALLMQLEETKRREQAERETVSFERISSGYLQTSVTAKAFGIVALRESAPTVFGELVQTYHQLLDQAFERRAFKVEHNTSDDLRSLSERLGFVKASARDVVELHTTAMKKQMDSLNAKKAAVYAEEGRLMLLELMGYLLTRYRNHSLGLWRVSSPPEEDNDE